jgi:hypothetical protein
MKPGRAFITIDDDGFLAQLADLPEGKTVAIAPHDNCTILYTSERLTPERRDVCPEAMLRRVRSPRASSN